MAPKQRDGIKSPAGTLIPKVKIVTMNLKKRARMRSHIAV
jgi:hypothetical protein